MKKTILFFTNRPVVLINLVLIRTDFSSQNAIHVSRTNPEQLQFMQTTFLSWLKEVEDKCESEFTYLFYSNIQDSLSDIRQEIRHLKMELQKLYDEPSLKKVRETLLIEHLE